MSTEPDPLLVELEKLRNEVQEREKGIGWIVIKGNEPINEEETKYELSKYTQEEISALRFMLINKPRQKYLDKARLFLDKAREQVNDRTMLFASTSPVVDSIFEELSLLTQKKLPEQFDRLFALTYYIPEYWFWYHDTEEPEECQKIFNLVAILWKNLFFHNSELLNIDDEFTRPGIIQFIGDVKDDIEKYGYTFGSDD